MPKSQSVKREYGDTAMSEALSSGRLSETDLLRLKAIARLHARDLPPGIGWMDLLQEALLRALRGSRPRPPDLPIVTFIAGVMRSIKSEHWRRARREAETHTRLADRAESPLDPERSLAAQQQLALIYRLFADDPAALQVIAGLSAGVPAGQIRAACGMSKTDYDSTRKRMRRMLLREGLAWRRS